jgi:hypothetical protein
VVESLTVGEKATLLAGCPTAAQSAEWYDLSVGSARGWVRSDHLRLGTHKDGGVAVADAGSPPKADAGQAPVDSGTPSGYAAMGVPAYAGSTWTAAERTNDEDFHNLNNWNYGFTDDNASGASGNYYPWGASGSAPYWGSSMNPKNVMDYDVPGNVYQTSTGPNANLFGTYSPQTFSSTGWGGSFWASSAARKRRRPPTATCGVSSRPNRG